MLQYQQLFGNLNRIYANTNIDQSRNQKYFEKAQNRLNELHYQMPDVYLAVKFNDETTSFCRIWSSPDSKLEQSDLDLILLDLNNIISKEKGNN